MRLDLSVGDRGTGVAGVVDERLEPFDPLRFAFDGHVRLDVAEVVVDLFEFADVVGREMLLTNERPKCGGVVKSTGEDCANTAIYLGSGMFGAHCYSHATPPSASSTELITKKTTPARHARAQI